MKDKIDWLNIELESLFESLIKYSNEEINFKPNIKKWSIGEHMYHLWLSETSIEKYIKKKTSYPETLVKVSRFSRIRLALLNFIFFIGIKFKAPKIVVDPIPKNVDLVLLKKDWVQSRKTFNSLIESLDITVLNKAILRHPISGRINMNMTLDFLIYHFNHHKKIIHKLENKL